jgi:hypothetical protein
LFAAIIIIAALRVWWLRSTPARLDAPRSKTRTL